MTDSCDLADKHCAPCSGDVPPLDRAEAESMLGQLDEAWRLNELGHLQRSYPFKNFMAALDFANTVGAIAESEGHHPDLLVAWGRCGMEIWTHKIDGLAEADFILAAKADQAYRS
jgi:4a-hydroxytetrahydrobiopterin dehydratase